jgi:hypothetical protein
LPSIIPSYIYTLFASIIVGTIVICACSLSTLNVRNEAEKQQLLNVAEYVSTKSLELISHAKTDNLTSTLRLNVPSLIGDKRYWIQIANDSFRGWVEVGFGTTAQSSEHRIYIPSEASTSGTYTSGSGVASLECYSDSSGVHLTLSGGS